MPISRAVLAATILLTAATTHAEDTANSVTVLSTADLEQRGITGIDGVAEALPQISSTPALNSLSTLSLYMRGEGPAAAGQITLDSPVAIYQDGFYISRLQANTFDLLDLERVEVLAGPQGALYGRDSAGGVINLLSQAPSGKLRFDEHVDFGNLNSYRVLSSVDLPRWNGFSAKVTGVVSGSDGYVKNAIGTQHDFGEEKQRAARLQLLWDGLDNLRAAYFIERSGLDSTPGYDQNPSLNGQSVYPPFTYYADPDGPNGASYRPLLMFLSTSNHTAQGLTLTWSVLPALQVQSLTGYRSMTSNEYQEYGEFFGYSEFTKDFYRDHQFSQELRFSGELFDRQLSYLVGASYFREVGTHSNDIDLYGASESQTADLDAKTRSQAVYAQLRWQPAFAGRHLEIAAAARRTRDSKDALRYEFFNATEPLEDGARNHLSYNRTNPELSLTWHWSDAISTYAKVATAYVAGGALENAPVTEFASTFVRPESTTTYEVGLRSAWLGERLHADITAFDSRRRDVQYVLPVDITDALALSFQRVTVRGASLDLRFAPWQDLELTARVDYLHSSIDRADAVAGSIFDPAAAAGSPYYVGENVKDVFALPYTPRYAASLASDYTFLHLDRRDLMLHLDYVYRDRMFAEAGTGPAVPGSQFDTQPAYGLLNGRLTLSQETDWSHRLKFSLWGRNLLNRKYYQPEVGVGAPAELSGVAALNASSTGLAGYTSRAGAWAQPLTYGLNITYEY
jgi:iron complex outermembrane receptor protein